MTKNWNNWYEILTHYEALASAIPYSQYMPKPKQSQNESHSAFGKRLDEYDEMIIQKNIEDKKNKTARNEIYDEMQHEIFKYFEVEWNDRKARKAWDIAWAHGHSSGYNDVVGYFEELVELIKPLDE